MVAIRISWLLPMIGITLAKNSDIFNSRYNGTTTSLGITSFGLEDWNKISCTDVKSCAGYPDSWNHARNWTLPLRSNCQWCPVGTKNSICGFHSQSPIVLRRETALTTDTNSSTYCPDTHWMQYQDGSCKWNDYKKTFAIERHALRIYVPINASGEIGCNPGRQGIFPRIDFSHGFPNWWFLMHTEIKCPSEHSQDGKQYDCEVVLSHFYSISSGNRAGQVSIFLQAYPNQDCWPFLDKLICQWRQVEEKVRSDCGLDPAPPYPGCQLFRNQKSAAPTPAPFPSTGAAPIVDCTPYQVQGINTEDMCNGCCGWLRSDSDFCLSVYNTYGANINNACYNCCEKLAAPLPPINPSIPQIDCTTVSHPSQMCDDFSCCEPQRSQSTFCQSKYKEWGSKIKSICWYCCKSPKLVGPSRRLTSHNETDLPASFPADLKGNPNTEENVLMSNFFGQIKLHPQDFRPKEDDEAHFQRIHQDFKTRNLAAKHLINFDDVYYWPYEWLVAVQTEYYFRYQGSLTVPPCYETVHWRVMKDPIRLCDRQIIELKRLLAWRVAPKGSLSNACKSDTAGRVRTGSKGNLVDVNRPLQNTTNMHFQVFCECANFASKFDSDKNWCKGWKDTNKSQRFFRHPYNFESNGQF